MVNCDKVVVVHICSSTTPRQPVDLDPFSPLLRLMNEALQFHGYRSPSVPFYFEAVRKDPATAPTLAFALASITKSPDAP
jgi:hypothetical protein